MRKLQQYLLMVLVLASAMNSFADGKQVTFSNSGDLLSGHYILPDQDKPRGVILFVHGDGPLAYDAHGYYSLIWKRLLHQGFAVFSWDKPGVGESTGNWLAQSMKQRQQEVQAAISFVRGNYGYTGDQVGLLGFSQAGWVVPAVANKNPDVGFVIGIGFAIDWLEQSWYLTHVRLMKQGARSSEIEAAYALHLKEIKLLTQKPSYASYLKDFVDTSDPITQERYPFILKNLSVNASKDYIGLKKPMLLLLGDKDLNVDIANTKKVIENLVNDQQRIQISIIKNATHSMLDAKSFNEQTPGLSFY